MEFKRIGHGLPQTQSNWWVLFIMLWFHTEVSFNWLVGERRLRIMSSVLHIWMIHHKQCITCKNETFLLLYRYSRLTHVNTGCMNPVRSFGPAIILAATPNEYQPEQNLEDDIFTGHWVYWIGPLLGSLIAAVTHRILGIYSNYRPRSEGDNVLGRVRLSVCPSVSQRSHGWTVWPTTLIFGM